ncbi:MAG: hypothetical protein J6W52_03295 [Bacteroidaceae bacterium]|nr:hypothetical protein [Bacteroidaceae bacterium]
MIHVLFAAFMLTALPDDTIPTTRPQTDSLNYEQTDTLREVDVIAPGRTQGLEDAIRQGLARMGISRTPSLGEVLERIKPGLKDKIMHPFAFKERKRARKRKRVKKILDDFEATRTFDDLLREALEREGVAIPPKQDNQNR